jgi:excisionase family DNA binding protein
MSLVAVPDPPEPPDEYMTKGEVAALLRVTAGWVEKATTRSGQLPYTRVGRYRRHRRSAIERYLADNSHDVGGGTSGLDDGSES